jgi:hypothetical protein
LEPKEASFSAGLLGKRCLRIHAIEHSFDGAVCNPYNALFLETDQGASFRFLFDLDTFFWMPEPPRVWPSRGRNSYRLVEPEELRPLYGRVVRSVDFASIPGGARQLVVRFEGGGEFRYWNNEVGGSQITVDTQHSAGPR